MLSLDFQRCWCDEVGDTNPSSWRTSYGLGISLQDPRGSKRFGFEMHQEGSFEMCTEIQEWDRDKYIIYR